MVVVDALLDAPDRVGWRGHQEAWVRRARDWMLRCSTDDLRRLAAVVDDVRLLLTPAVPGERSLSLTPPAAVACLVPTHRPNTWQALCPRTGHGVSSDPRCDAQHWLLGRRRRSHDDDSPLLWLGVLTWVLRCRRMRPICTKRQKKIVIGRTPIRRGRVTRAWIEALQRAGAAGGVLGLALDDGHWLVDDATTTVRARTTLVCLIVDWRATDAQVAAAALRWWRDGSSGAVLDDLVREALWERGGGAAQGHHDQHLPSSPMTDDVMFPAALRFFDD